MKASRVVAWSEDRAAAASTTSAKTATQTRGGFIVFPFESAQAVTIPPARLASSIVPVGAGLADKAAPCRPTAICQAPEATGWPACNRGAGEALQRRAPGPRPAGRSRRRGPRGSGARTRWMGRGGTRLPSSGSPRCAGPASPAIARRPRAPTRCRRRAPPRDRGTVPRVGGCPGPARAGQPPIAWAQTGVPAPRSPSVSSALQQACQTPRARVRA